MSSLAGNVQVQPSGASLGADVVGVDLKSLDTTSFDVVKAAWLDHLVIRIRGQDFNDDEHLRLSGLFGPLVDQPLNRKTGQPFFPGKPTLGMISNIREEGEYIGALGDAEVTWHTDMAFTPNPPSASLLHAIEIPTEGGLTWFANMYAAYDSLPGAERKLIENRQVKIGNMRDTAGSYRYGYTPDDFSNVVDCPGPLHNLVKVHPDTGLKCLYLGQRQDAYIMGLPLDESDDLLDRLWAHATRDELTWGQEWQVGDLLIWDNRCTLHRRDPFDPNSRRRLHRTVVGEPVAA